MANKKTEVKETAVKEVVKETAKADVKEASKAEVKDAPKTETKKAPAKKTAAKKATKTTTAKTAKTEKTASVDTELYVQFAGNEVTTSDIIGRVKAAYVAEGHRESAIKSIKLYIKPEEYAAYYVVNDMAMGKINLF